MKEKKNNSDYWYKLETPSGVKYTPFAIDRATYVAAPNEEEKLVKELNKGKRDLHNSGRVIKKFSSDDSALQKIELPNGFYVYKDGCEDEFLIPFEVRTDTYITIGGTADKVKQSIQTFYDTEKVYRDLGVIYKLGLLLYGVPGCGKTALVREVLKDKDKEALVIFIEKEFPSDAFIIRIKESLKDRLKIFVFEELAVDLSEYFVGRLLTFLDGELSVDKSIVFATTNYPEKIPGNIVNRPSRFDKLYEFELPNDRERKLFFESYLSSIGRSLTDEEVAYSKGLSVADIKEACIQILINNMDLKAAIKQMKDRDNLCKKAFSKQKDLIGFGGKWVSGEE